MSTVDAFSIALHKALAALLSVVQIGLNELTITHKNHAVKMEIPSCFLEENWNT